MDKFINRENFVVLMYLVAIVAANLIITAWGPAASIVTAFIFIGLDLSSRDFLHEAWDNDGLIWKMALLIAAGSIISYALNVAAGPIALASFCAFAAAGVIDAVVYHFLKDRTRLVRINGSNVFSSAADSVIFPLMAFGNFPGVALIMLGQFASKFFGGALWGFVIDWAYKKFDKKKA
jgi:queuosine precursor transporter